jgi:nitrogen fixation NifU-like protein
MDLYREEILDHYKRPHNFGHLAHASAVGEEHNISCGDKIIMEVVISKTAKVKKIVDVRFSGSGCAISVASASMLTDRVIGMSVASIMKLTLSDIQDALGTTLMPARVKCAMLSLEVLQKTVSK